MERIPALRRLSDSALRVTSATASDGRLAALALYRLGAAARAAEAAAQATPALASSARSATAASAAAASAGAAAATNATTADPSVEVAASAAAALKAGVDDAAAVATDMTRTLTEEEAEGSRAGVGVSERELAGVTCSSDGGGTVLSPPSSAPSATATAAVLETKEPGSLPFLGPDATASKASGNGEDRGRMMEGVVGVGMGEERSPSVSFPTSTPPSSEQDLESEPRDGEPELPEQEAAAAAAADADAAAAQAREEEERASSAAAAPAIPIFDMDAVRGDQRFEQLVEIVECVASGLSVSDISKVSEFHPRPLCCRNLRVKRMDFCVL